MLDRYITINENKIICGQSSGGIWYCKELPAKDTNELDHLIGLVNGILNKYNTFEQKKLSKDKKVKGLE